jgi:hypothetical protein
VSRSKIMRLGSLGASVLASLVYCAIAPAFADGCPKPADEIETDWPDITNCSRVAPQGCLQFENGINFTTPESSRVLDGTNTRARLEIAPCLEVLVDVPTLSGPAASGFTDVASMVKWQISPVPGKIDFSVAVGIGLPSGTTSSPKISLNCRRLA